MRASERIALLERQLAEERAYGAVLKGALIAAAIDPPRDLSWAAGVTEQEGALLGALLRVYPRPLSRYAIEELLPSREHTAERDAAVVKVLVCRIRRRLGPDVIETVRGGWRLSRAAKERAS